MVYSLFYSIDALYYDADLKAGPRWNHHVGTCFSAEHRVLQNQYFWFRKKKHLWIKFLIYHWLVMSSYHRIISYHVIKYLYNLISYHLISYHVDHIISWFANIPMIPPLKKDPTIDHRFLVARPCLGSCSVSPPSFRAPCVRSEGGIIQGIYIYIPANYSYHHEFIFEK